MAMADGRMACAPSTITISHQSSAISHLNVLRPPPVQPRMRTYLLAIGLLLLAVPAAYAVFDASEHVSRTIEMKPGGTLRLKSFSGRVTIAASDRPEMVIDAVRRGPRDRLDRVKLDIHTDGANVVVVDA